MSVHFVIQGVKRETAPWPRGLQRADGVYFEDCTIHMYGQMKLLPLIVAKVHRP